MAFPGDLLDQANQLIWKERKHPKQVSLCRGISLAYYALFHLLIHDAAANWNQRELRAGLERGFDHQTMKVASNRASDAKASPFHGEDPDVVRRLRAVARTFSDLQRERHSANYDNGRVWLRAQAVDLVKRLGMPSMIGAQSETKNSHKPTCFPCSSKTVNASCYRTPAPGILYENTSCNCRTSPLYSFGNGGSGFDMLIPDTAARSSG